MTTDSASQGEQRPTPEPLTARVAELRLAQYGERTSTWSTATYDSGTEKALHEIALALLAELDRTRAELAKYVGHEPTLTEEALYAHEEKVRGRITAGVLRKAADALRVEHRRIFWATKPATCPEAEFLDRMADTYTTPAGGTR